MARVSRNASIPYLPYSRLTVATAGRNIAQRGDPLLTSVVGVVFYVASFTMLIGARQRR